MKTKNTVKATVAAEATAPEVVATSVNQPVLVIVKRELKFRGARQAWYDALCKMDGKPRGEVIAALESNRPSNYGNKSKHAGTPEPVAGWVRFYERNGYIAFRQ